MIAAPAGEFRSPSIAPPLLAATDVCAGYGRRQVLYDVSVALGAGEIVAVLGHNGAGKTTLLKTIVGFVPLRRGRVAFAGRDRSGDAYTARVRDGISYTPAEAPVFRDLTVRDNLELGGFTVADRAERAARMERVFDLFPILRERHGQFAGTM
ncbi:MAG TPA: ATP-binding cassette domain-containing protein, partial [Thermomicrobiales bacterium]|nr:ATP-binding cassette domain-containing protein [Thermomicrobiales bacterium]